jgi:hypothetical protein
MRDGLGADAPAFVTEAVEANEGRAAYLGVAAHVRTTTIQGQDSD